MEKRKEPERGGEGEEWADARARTNTHVPSLSALAALPLSVVEEGSSEDVVITRKRHKVHKTNFINPIAAVTNTEAEYIYSTKKKTRLLILKMK